MTGEDHLKIAQVCFAEWLHELDAVLIEAQREHQSALDALRTGDTNKFAEHLGIMAARVDEARSEIADGLERGV